MDFWKTMGILLRRWYVSVPIFVISLGLGGAVFVAVPTQYESTGTVVLTAPTTGASVPTDPKLATGPGNPLLDFEGSLTITTQLLIQSLSSPTVQQQIGDEGGVSTFQAGDGNTGGPFVVIIADATSRAQAEKTVTLALQFAKTELNARQKALNAPASTYIGTQIVVPPTPATTKLGSKVKAGGVALALGLVASLASAFAVESIMTNRRRRKTEQAKATDIDEDLLDDPDEDDELSEDGAQVTHKMRPAPPPRQIPQPVRSSSGPRQSPHPQTGSVGDRSGSGRREPYGPGPMPVPMHKPHPAKPRVLPPPAPLPNSKPNAGSGNGNGNNGGGKGQNNNNHDWPRAEFRSPDKSTG